MIYILSWTTKKHQNSVQATTFRVKESSRTFQGLAQKFKDFSRTSPNIQGLFKTVQTLWKKKRYFLFCNMKLSS